MDGSLSHSVPANHWRSNVGLSMTDAAVRNAVTGILIRVRAFRNICSCFELPTRLLQTEKSLTLATLDRHPAIWKNQGLFYAELRFAPQHYTRLGLTQQQTVAAVLKGVDMAKQAGPSDPDRHSSVHARNRFARLDNQETAELAVAYQGYRHRRA